MWKISENSMNGDCMDTTLKPEFTETFQLSKFEVKTLAFLPIDKSLINTSSHSISSPSFIAITFDDKLTVFNEDTGEIFFELVLNSNWDCVTLSSDFSLLLGADRSGTIHFLHLPTRKSIWSYKCEENENICSIQNIICSSVSPDFFSIYIYTNEGILFEFSRIEILSLCKALEEERVSEFFSEVCIKKIDLTSMFPYYTIKSVFETFSRVSPVGLEVEESSFDEVSISDYYPIAQMVDGDFTTDSEWNEEEKKFFIFDVSGNNFMTEISSSRDGRYIVCLDQKNMLLIFSTYTQHNLIAWGDQDVQSFTLYDNINSDSLSTSESKIGILRKLNDNYIFEIRKFPSLEYFHKIQLSEYAQLIKSKPNQESWYVIEGSMSLSTKNTATLKLVSVSESSSEARLMSLLNRRKFREAEKYAKMCNLNEEIIYKTKINCMLKDYAADHAAILTKKEQECIWKEVEDCLNKIKDIDYIKSCISSLTPEMELMRKFLSCINHWLVANKIEGAEDLISQINQNENKLVTYSMLPDSIQSNLSLKDFLSKDLLQFLIGELLAGCLNTALIVWKSHKDEFLISLTSVQVQEILSAIPDDLPSHHLILFLKDEFLPFVLIQIPLAVDIIAEWMISRIHLLEITEKEFWPENGDQLASMFLQVLQMLQENAGKRAISYSTTTALSFVHKKSTNCESQTGCLNELSKNLKLLLKLKKNFNCKISLTTFQDSKMDVLFCILDRISLKYIGKVITEIARPFALENGLDLDLCLEKYIKNTLQTSNFTWWSWDETPWEEHLSLVLECIHDADRWMKAALLLVSHAPVPWNERIKNIVKKGLSCDHSSREEFKKQSKELHLKEVLKKYDIRRFSMDNDMNLIYTLVDYILKQNRASAHEDVKCVILAVKDCITVEDCKKFLLFHLNQNQIDELVDMLSSIPLDLAVECSYSVLKNIIFVLEDSFLVEKNQNQIKTYLYAAIIFMEFLKSQKKAIDQELLEAFRCMQKLIKEFELCVTLSNVTQKEKALKIVENLVDKTLEKISPEIEIEQNEIAVGIFKTKRLSCILGLEIANVLSILITKCLEKQKYTLVIKLCGELISSYPTATSAETLIEVINHFSLNFQNIKNVSFEAIVAALCHMSNLVITHCETDNIEKYMYAVHLSTYLNVLNKITGQRLSVLPSLKTDIYHKWRFDAFYEDDGFQLDIIKVANFVLKALLLFHRNSRNLETALDFPMEEQFNGLFKPVIIHMKENGQELCALRTMFLFYHLQMQFLQNDTSSRDAFSMIAENIKDSVNNLLHRMIDKRKLDMEVCIGLLSLFPNEQINLLKKLQRWSAKDLRCIMSLGEIGTECCRVFSNPEHSEYDKIYRRALLLFKQNVEVPQADVALNSHDSEYNWDVVKEIILNPKTNLSTIFECCDAFDLIEDHVLIAFINNLLIESDKLCLSSSEMKEDSFQIMLKKTKCAIEAVTSEGLVLKNLESMVKKVSSYSYEVLLFIHEQLLKASADVLTITSGQFEKTIGLLNFLKVYKRVSPPGEVELERWISSHPTDTNLPTIAQKRLPFWLIFEEKLFKIINPELTSNTLIVWLNVAPLLNISKDDLVMIAVKNVVMNYLEKLPTKHLILQQDNFFLYNIYEMLGNISEPQSAVACASWSASRMPPGPNKVCVCMIALKFSEKWQALNPNDRKTSEILKKSKELYQRSAVERIIYQNNLSNDTSLSYIQNPVQLVEYFIEEYSFSSESSIKVCKVAAEIAEIMDITLNEIFKKKLLKWMCSSQTSNNLDETFSFNDSAENIDLEDDCDDKNIIRAINLLLGLSAINHDICESLKNDYPSMTVIQRSRFIFCTVAVYGYAAVAQVLNLSSNILEESLTLFLCTAELEHLHLLYSKEMITANKIAELVQSILSNQRNNPNVLLCCIKMCTEFKIWSSQIWDVLLQRLNMMSMTESLTNILQSIQGNLVHMWHYKSFVSAWNSIICNCFKSELTDATKIIESVYKAVLSCPCVSALDVESIWNDLKYCIKSIKGKDMKEMETVSDANTFIKALKSLQEKMLLQTDE